MKSYWYDGEPVNHAYLSSQPHVLTVRQGDQREEHDSGRSVSAGHLSQLGVLYYHCPSVSDVDEIASKRSYKNRDEITISPVKMGDMYEGSCVVGVLISGQGFHLE